MRKRGLLFALALLAGCSDADKSERLMALDQANQDARCAGPPDSPGDQWPHGLISNERLAINVASETMEDFFEMAPEPPFQVRLERGIWYVNDAAPPSGSVGGSLHIEMCQSNGRVLNIYGTQ